MYNGSATLESTASVPINLNGNKYICSHCERTFLLNNILDQYLRLCKLNPTTEESGSTNERNEDIEASPNTTNTTLSSSPQRSKYTWGNYKSRVFGTNVSIVYEQIVYWKKNLFLLPSGKTRKQFTDKTTQLMYERLQNSPLKDIAFKAIMIMLNLLLQKPSKNSKSKDHLKVIERRIELWTLEGLLDLLEEDETIQKISESRKTSTNIAEISKKFSQEIKKGNVNSAMEILSNNIKNEILSFTK